MDTGKTRRGPDEGPRPLCFVHWYFRLPLRGEYTVLFTKSLMDGVAAIIFASTWGVGVLLSGSLVLLYQGAITLLAQWISPLLSDAVINEMSCAGYLLIVALALNMLGITKMKVMNCVPAVFLPILLCQFL